MRRLALLGMMMVQLAVAPAVAHQDQTAGDLQYNKKGFELGFEGNLLGTFEPTFLLLPGKFDFLIGARFNPYFSLNLDLWSFWFLAYGAELRPKVNLTDARVSPFLIASVGPMTALTLDEGKATISFLTYSAGIGLDIHLNKQKSFFMAAKYRGAHNAARKDELNNTNALEVGLGLQWVF